jgi:hypothetical protein
MLALVSIDANKPSHSLTHCCRVLGISEICGQTPKVCVSAGPQCIENPLPSRPCCPGCQRTLNQFDIRFPASRSFILCPIACEAVQICASAIFLLSEGHSAFPDQRMALFSSRFQFRGESSPVSFRSKRRPFCGENWGLLAKICRLKKTQDCMVDQVESEPFSTPEFRQQTQFGSELVQSPIARYADRMCQ